MTNEQIIANSAVAAGIFTQEEAEAYFSHGMRLPDSHFRRVEEPRLHG